MRESTPALAVLALGAALVAPGLLRDFLFLVICPGCSAAVYPRWLWAREDRLLPGQCLHCGLRLR